MKNLNTVASTRSISTAKMPRQSTMRAQAHSLMSLEKQIGKANAQEVLATMQAIHSWAEMEGHSPKGMDLQSGMCKPQASRFRPDGGQSWLAQNPLMSFDISDAAGFHAMRCMSDAGLICDVTFDGGEAHYHFTETGRLTFTRLMYPQAKPHRLKTSARSKTGSPQQGARTLRITRAQRSA